MRERLDSLTGLRFFAALLVVWHHSSYLLGEGAPFALAGHVGVSFFFVLSGFVLAWSHRPGDRPGAFLWRRFARVWPAHALVWGVALAVLATPSLTPDAAPWATLALVQAWSANEYVTFFGNSPSWSLSAEAFFYVMFPLLIAIVPRQAVWAGRVAGGVLAAMFVWAALTSDPLVLYTLPAYRIGEFIVGVLLARAMLDGWRPGSSLGRAAAVAVLVYAVVAVTGLGRYWAALVMVPLFAVVIAAAAVRDLEGGCSWLRSRWAVRLGQWSFALYLVHMPVLKWLSEHGVSGLGAYVLAVVACVGLSGVVFEFFERPVERWLRGLSARRRARVVAEPARA